MKKLQNFRRMLGVGLALLLCVVCFGKLEQVHAASWWEYDEATKTLSFNIKGALGGYGMPSDAPWYELRDEVEKVIFSEGVTLIGNYICDDFTSLKEVVIPDGVTKIGCCAFDGCKSLEEVIIPNSVTSIEKYAFRGCYSLKNITLSENLISIGESAFSNCSFSEKLIIPDNVTSIGKSSFFRCKAKEIVIPGSLTKIAPCAFMWADCTKVTILEGVTSIGYEAFYGCDYLEEVTIPDSVTDMAYGVFEDCVSLKEISMPDRIECIEQDMFYGCSKLKKIEWPNNLKEIGYNAFSGCDSLKEIVIPDSVTRIGGRSFSYCESLTSIEIPSSVTSIGDYAFSRCSKLKTISLDCNWRPDIESGNFYGASYINTVNYNHLGETGFIADDTADTISKVCDACGSLGTVTLLDPDADKKIVYDGTVKTTQYTDSIPGETPVITYTGAAATNGEAVNAGTYTATMTVGGQKVNVQFVIEKLEWAPNAPQKTVVVPYTMAKVKDVVLPENWAWQKSYTDLELTVGEVTEATAVYNGADKGNYKNEAVIVEITRAACVHEGGVATCVDKATCDVCGEKYGEVDATNHGDKVVKNQSEATCTAEGYTGDICCKDCGAVFEQGKAIEAKGHVGGTATCTEKATCEVCGEKYNEVNATNHGEKEVKNQVEATCTEAGYTGDTCCKDCGYVFASGETVAAKGHVYTSAVTKEPTVTETGVLTYTCANCDDTYTEVIEKLPDPAKGVVAEVTYATHWGNGGQVEITLTNGGEDLIGGWNVEFDLNITGELTNSWGDGYVTSFKDGHVMIQNQDWVQNFEAGTTKKVYLQYNGTLPGFVTCTQNGDALVASIIYLNHWGNGGQIEILLENTGAALTDGWGTELTINLTGKMAGTWGDGFVTSYENGHIVIKNQDWVKGFETGTKKSVWLQFDGILPVEASNLVLK